MEHLLDAIRANQVPNAWLVASHDSRQGLARWFIGLLRRKEALHVWRDHLKSGDAAPPAVWIAGLFHPIALVNSVKHMALRALSLDKDLTERVSWEQLTVFGYVTPWRSEADLGTSDAEGNSLAKIGGGLLVHGLVLEGAAWDLASASLVDAVLQDLHTVVPLVHMKAVLVQNAATGVKFPIDLHDTFDDDPPYPYECPVYARPQRGDSFLFTTRVNSQERQTKWVYRAAAMILDV